MSNYPWTGNLGEEQYKFQKVHPSVTISTNDNATIFQLLKSKQCQNLQWPWLIHLSKASGSAYNKSSCSISLMLTSLPAALFKSWRSNEHCKHWRIIAYIWIATQKMSMLAAVHLAELDFSVFISDFKLCHQRRFSNELWKFQPQILIQSINWEVEIWVPTSVWRVTMFFSFSTNGTLGECFTWWPSNHM